METKWIIITGATSGIGLATALELAKKGYSIGIIARNRAKSESVNQMILKRYPQVKTKVFICDLSDLSQVSACADQIISEISYLHALINNAGGIFPKLQWTEQRMETSFVVNHLSHYLLTKKLMPLLINSKTRIINVSSEAHRAAKGTLDSINEPVTYSSFSTYADVKLFNILFTKSLIDNFGKDGLRAYALHPGVVRTGFGSEYKGWMKTIIQLAQPFMISPQKGAETSVYLATSELPDSQNGGYFASSKLKLPTKTAMDPILRERLWQLSEQLVLPYL
jgi:NAD(P)-dependent dehydrogenase (short-subunit alcohol dehydrogenase family)